MKTLLKLIVGIFIGTSCICEAQSIASQQTQVRAPAPIPYAITAQDANSRVWQMTDYQISPYGGVITNTHSYTEIASGLNHLVNGRWVASSEQIDILPNGTAVSTNGQHQARFPGDIYVGQIELVTPDGQLLQSRPLALSYFDGTNTMVIAELTNSIGVVVGNNQVVYPNAFTGFKVDLSYTYTKSGFEQDIVLRQQPPTPESLGLNPDTARLQVMTEFFSPMQPTIRPTALPSQAGLALSDENLGFGAMQMVPGRAFLMGQNAKNGGALVSKHWLIVKGRQVLIEEVPVNAILEGLAALPMTAMNSSSNKNSHTVFRQLTLPTKRLMVRNTSKNIMLAKAELPMQGFVLDYQTVSGGLTNYTFQGDTTYYISGSLSSFGTSTFEGGAVIKYATNGTIFINPGLFTPSINWKGAAYRPVIFTAIDDNSVGDTISGSTGNPVGHYYGNGMLSLAGLSLTLTNLRMSYASTAITISGASANIYNAQFVNCQYGFNGSGANIALRNALFANPKTNFYSAGGFVVDAQNVTFSGNNSLFVSPSSPSGCSFTLTNCIFANVTNLSTGYATAGGSYNGFYNAPKFGSSTFTNTFYPFQKVGAGNYYLTNGSPFRDVGTVTINSSLLAAIRTKTTYSPILYSNVTLSINTTISPQAQRDIDTPDLGYHYDPLDFIVDKFTVTNALFIVTNGAAIASYNETGVQLRDGSSILSCGSPVNPNWFVRYTSVQEQSVLLGGTNPASGITVGAPHYGNAGPAGQFLFSKFSCPAGGGYLFNNNGTNAYSSLLVQNCELWSGLVDFSGSANSATKLQNNLFDRSSFSVATAANTALSVSNNLFYGTTIFIYNQATTNKWLAFNNAFDSCGIYYNPYVPIGNLTNGYNAYLNCSGFNGYIGQLWPTNVFDIVTNATLVYQTGPLGMFYQPSNSPLINKGSKTANLVGLYHYCVTTNEVKETNSVVDVGYHYVAMDTNGSPIDTDGDGLADYCEDINGNGIYDTGDLSDWAKKSTDGTGMSDEWEIKYFGSIGQDPLVDPDADGLNNLQEFQNGTDPHNADSDGDYLSDGDEVNKYKTNPNKIDTDGDGRTDWQEVYDGTDPLNPASFATWAVVADRPYNGSGFAHPNDSSPNESLTVWNSGGIWYYTILNGDPNAYYDLSGSPNIAGPWIWLSRMKVGAQYKLINPLYSSYYYRIDPPQDTDLDGLTDVYEKEVTHTDPNNPDSDGDGLSDGLEVQLGTDPLNAYSQDTTHTQKDGAWYLTGVNGQSHTRLQITLDTGDSYYDSSHNVTVLYFAITGMSASDQIHVYIQTPSVDVNDSSLVWQDMFAKIGFEDFGYPFGSSGGHYFATEWPGVIPLNGSAKFAVLDNQDRDFDGLPDGYEIQSAHTIVGAPSSSNNGVADGDADPSQDGLSFVKKLNYGLNPLVGVSTQDSLGNGLPDWMKKYIVFWYGVGADDPWADPDGDKVPNIVEYDLGTDPVIGDYWADLPPPPGDESQQFGSFQVSASYGASDGPNGNSYFPNFGIAAGPLGLSCLMTANNSGSGAGTANLDFEISPLDKAYNDYAPFSATADPAQGELQEFDPADVTLYRNLVLQSADLAHHVWEILQPNVLNALGSRTLEYVHAVSMLKIQLQAREIQWLQYAEVHGANGASVAIQIETRESVIHTEITKIVAVDLRYAQHYPDLDLVGRLLHVVGFAAVGASLITEGPELLDAYNGYHIDVQNHQDTAGAAILSSNVQQALIDFLNLFSVPNIQFLEIELSPDTPVFDPIPFGLYDGGGG